MAQDEKIPRTNPGVASFRTRSYGNSAEPAFGEGEARTIDVEIVTTATIDFKLYDVLNYNPTTKALTKAVVASGAGNANCIAAQPIAATGSGVTFRAAVYVTGHWAMDALGWDATFTTDQLKQMAFMAGGAGSRSEITVSKKKFNDDAIDIPN
jgi:hypothetical protein